MIMWILDLIVPLRAGGRPELIIQSILPIIQIFYSHFPSLLFKKLSPIIQVFQSISNT